MKGSWKHPDQLFCNSTEHLLLPFPSGTPSIKLSKGRFAYIPRVKEHDILPNVNKDPIKANMAICSPNGFLTSAALKLATCSRRQLSREWRLVKSDMSRGIMETPSTPQMISFISQPQLVWTEFSFFAENNFISATTLRGIQPFSVINNLMWINPGHWRKLDIGKTKSHPQSIVPAMAGSRLLVSWKMHWSGVRDGAGERYLQKEKYR